MQDMIHVVDVIHKICTKYSKVAFNINMKLILKVENRNNQLDVMKFYNTPLNDVGHVVSLNFKTLYGKIIQIGR